MSEQLPDTKPGNYYVSARRDNGDAVCLLGPFRDDHAKALSMVDAGREAAEASGDPRACWYSYGTLRTDYDYDRPGILNAAVARKVVGDTILAQLGGNKFLTMTGAHSLTHGERELQMHVPRKSGRRIFRVELAGDDTYRVRLYRMKRGLELENVGAQDDVTAEMLPFVFERMTGLRTGIGQR